MHDPLQGRLILIIEGDAFRSGYIETALVQAGAQILGPARSIDEANEVVKRLRTPPTAAVIDLDLFEAAGFIAGDILVNLRVPLLLMARSSRVFQSQSSNHAMLVTPFAAYQVLDHLRAVLTQAVKTSIYVPAGPTLRGH